MARNGKATGFVGHFQDAHRDLYYLITNHHVLQGRRDKPSNITITFKDCNPLKGNELFSDKRWLTDNGTNLQDNVCCNIVCVCVCVCVCMCVCVRVCV